MKLRFVLALVTAVATVLPVTGASAEHCAIPIYLFTRTRAQTDVENPTAPGTKVGATLPGAVSSLVGCDVIGGDDPTIPGDESDTDYIYPGANRMSVRFLMTIEPTRATLEFAGTTYDLTMTRGIDVTGAAGDFYDSQNVEVNPANSLAGETATATVCIEDENEEEFCFARTYRTVV